MSRENIEIVRTGLEALNRRDIDAVLGICDPDVELRPSLVGGIEHEVFHGHEGYRRWFEEQFETYEEVSFELHDIRAAGEHVVAVYTIRIRGAQSGVELEAPGATLVTIKDGLVTRQVGYQSQQEAMRAAGEDRDPEPDV